jgi:hypothetical protein
MEIRVSRSLSDIDLSTAANDLRPSASVLGFEQSSMYSSEYTSGFLWPAALQLAVPPLPRYEGNVGQAPSLDRLRRSVIGVNRMRKRLGK